MMSHAGAEHGGCEHSQGWRSASALREGAEAVTLGRCRWPWGDQVLGCLPFGQLTELLKMGHL